MDLRDNIMTDIDLLLDRYNTRLLANKIAENTKKIRIQQNFTQKELSDRSGVKLSTLKRFEQKGEISLSNMLKLAVTLDVIDEFEKLFTSEAKTIDELLKEEKVKERKRVRKG